MNGILSRVSSGYTFGEERVESFHLRIYPEVCSLAIIICSDAACYNVYSELLGVLTKHDGR